MGSVENPFEAPDPSWEWQSESGIHLGRALWEANDILTRLPQLLPLLVVGGLGFYTVCCSAGVLVVVVLPVVAWGLHAYVLAAIEGAPRPGTLWSGVRQPAGAAWAVAGLWAMHSGPLLVSILGSSLAGLLLEKVYLWLLLGSASVSLLAARLLAAPFLMVEHGVPFPAAVGLSWQLTTIHPARWRLIASATVAVSGPLHVLVLYASRELARYTAAHPQQLELFGTVGFRYVWGPNAAVLLLAMVAGVWSMGLAASAYRQLVPSPAELAARIAADDDAGLQ